MNGWVYFLRYGGCIYKIRTDGSSEKKLIDDKVDWLLCDGEWIYMAERRESSWIGVYWIYSKMKTDGTEKMELLRNIDFVLKIEDGWIYYMNTNYEIHRMRADGSEDMELCKGDIKYSANIQGSWTYYTCPKRDGDEISYIMYKARLDGSDWTKLCGDNCIRLNVAGEWIYYINKADENSIYRIRTDGSGRTKLISDRASTIAIVDGWIYYTAPEEGEDGWETKLFRLKTNGSVREYVR